MRIGFVSANREVLPDPVIPLGVMSVMSTLPERHEKELWDLCFSTDPLAEIRARIREFKPDLLAIGLRNLQNNAYSDVSNNLRYYTDLIGAVRMVTRAPIVLGGGGFSVAPEALMAHLKPDYGIVGEGDYAFPGLVERLDTGAPIDDIPNLCYFSDREVHRTLGSGARIDINNLPIPTRDHVDARYYEAGIESVQSKRGCALRCDYCTYPLIEGRSYRLKDPARFVDEMIEVGRRRAVTHFFIVDSVFTIPPTHAKAICREMIRRGIDTPWTCYGNPIGFDADLAQLMNDAGCAGIEVGSDSGSDRVLKNLHKGFTAASIQNFHALCAAKGLKDCHTFILGTQGETLDEVRATLRFVADLNPYACILSVWNDDNDIFGGKAAEERAQFRKKVLEVISASQDLFPYSVVQELGILFDPLFFRLLRRRGVRGPLWQYIRNAGLSFKGGSHDEIMGHRSTDRHRRDVGTGRDVHY